MSSLALWAIRILRRLPHSARFDAHLTDCAALGVLYAPFGEAPEGLRLSHVVGLVPLPSLLPRGLEPMDEGIKPAACDSHLRGDVAPIVFDATHLFKRRAQSAM